MPELARSILRTTHPLLTPLAALAVLLLFNALFTPGFFAIDFRGGRLYGVPIDVLNHGSRVAVVALGMTLVIATGGVDLSVGAVAAIAGAVLATLATRAGVPWPAAIIAALAAGLVCGLWNSLLVTRLRLQPIVATLILMVAGRGIAQLITGGLIITYESPPLAAIANGSLLGLPFPVAILAVAAMCIWGATRRTSLGLFLEAVGDNEVASRLAGVPDRGTKVIAYAFCGLLAAVCGVVESSYIKAADANNAGNLLELDAILAVVIGGTALTGGRFSLAGTILGAMFMQTLTKTLYLLDVSAEIAPAPKAAVVILVCIMQSPVLRRRLGTLLPARRAA